jgi:hypothetical protein
MTPNLGSPVPTPQHRMRRVSLKGETRAPRLTSGNPMLLPMFRGSEVDLVSSLRARREPSNRPSRGPAISPQCLKIQLLLNFSTLEIRLFKPSLFAVSTQGIALRD